MEKETDNNINTKAIVRTLAVVGAAIGGYYLVKKGKKMFSDAKMNFAVLGFRIHKLTWQEVQFAVKLRCYNPTKAPLAVAVKQAIAQYKGKSIAFSKPNIEGVTIQPGKAEELEILFQVPYMNLVGSGLNIGAFQNKALLMAHLSFPITVAVNGETISHTLKLPDENMSGLALGQLGIVSGPRNTKDGTRYNHLIKKATGKDVYVKNGNVIETVEACIDIVANHYREVEKLAQLLRADTLKNTCRNIFNFAYTYLQYQQDKKGTEQLRTPARSWLDGQIRFKQQGDKKTGIDCDDYSIFCGSILKCLGIDFRFRITKYDGKTNFQHIYVFVPAKGDSENEIIIDPVLSKFDYQKPYSYEKSNFGMTALQLAGGIYGVDGLEGTTGLGLPIMALSGVNGTGGSIANEDHTELMAIVSGVDFEQTMNGLGNPEGATLNYLRRTRDFLLKNKKNRGAMAHIQNPDQFIEMLDQAIKYWNTPQRDAVLDKLIAIEDKLAEHGFIKYDQDAIEGVDEFDELEDELDGLTGDEEYYYDELGGRGRRRARRKKRRAKRKKRRARFFKAVKKVGKKVVKGGLTLAKKAVKTVIRFNPLAIAIRGGLLAAMRINLFGIAKKLHYAYLPDNLAPKYNVDPAQLRKLKNVHSKVKKLFRGLQGKEHNLRKAILKGAKQKSSDFSIKGTDTLLSELQCLEAIGELGELGDLGAAATAASVTAASGVLATIKKWLVPVKNIFSKIRQKSVARKMAKRQEKGKPISNKLLQKAEQLKQSTQVPPQELPTESIWQGAAKLMPGQTAPYESPQQTASFVQSQQTPAIMARTPTPAPTKKGLGKKAKIAIGVGAAALVGTGLYFAFRDKDDKKGEKTKTEKKSLGKITLQ